MKGKQVRSFAERGCGTVKKRPEGGRARLGSSRHEIVKRKREQAVVLLVSAGRGKRD